MYRGAPKKKPKNTGHGSLNDLLYLHRSSAPIEPDQIESLSKDALDGKTFATLLNASFPRLDPTGNGLTEESLSRLIMKPESFSQDEYSMLLLLAKYFKTIATLCPDKRSRQPVITTMDKEVLCQFLLHGNLNLSELHRWCDLSQLPEEFEVAPPPLSGSEC